MNHLTDADRQILAEQLQALKRIVLAELRSASTDAQTLAQDQTHEVRDSADDAEARRQDEVHFAEVEVDRVRLHDIEQAEQRMAQGCYGICVDCGQEIARERLLAQPIAIRCAACQSALESHQRR